MYNKAQDQELFALIVFFAFCLLGAWVASQLDLAVVASQLYKLFN